MNTPPPSFGSATPGPHQPEPQTAVRQLLPLTVWLCADPTDETTTTSPGRENNGKDRAQLCLRHRQRVGGQLARHLVTACTQEGDLVAEAFTCSEATLAAAAELGRKAIACVPHPPLAQHIGRRLRETVLVDKLAGLAMRATRPDQMASGLSDHLGKVALVVAAPPPCEIGGLEPRAAGSGRCPACRADFWGLGDQQLNAFLLASWRVLQRGGHLAVITTARHESGRLVDPAPLVIRQARVLGFRYSQHVIALRVPICGDELVVQADPGQLAQLRDVRSRALPPLVSVHADVCLLTKPRVGSGRAGAKGGAR